MNDLLQQGKILYWGTSEWSAEDITTAHKEAKKSNLRGPLMEQPQYNILHRDRFEKEYKSLYKKYGMGTTIWSPLASGLLTGKYNKGIPKKSRFTVKGYEWLGDSIDAADFKKIKNVEKIAIKLGVTPSQLSILWCLYNKNVSTVILGASNLKQLKENLDSMKYAELVTSEVISKINS
jgi:aryl-alcohol dehydrogenase-like predicted oxidoreductase